MVRRMVEVGASLAAIESLPVAIQTEPTVEVMDQRLGNPLQRTMLVHLKARLRRSLTLTDGRKPCSGKVSTLEAEDRLFVRWVVTSQTPFASRAVGAIGWDGGIAVQESSRIVPDVRTCRGVGMKKVSHAPPVV